MCSSVKYKKKCLTTHFLDVLIQFIKCADNKTIFNNLQLKTTFITITNNSYRSMVLYPTTEMPIDIFRTQNINFRNVVINRLHIWVEDFFNGPRVIKQRRGEYE